MTSFTASGFLFDMDGTLVDSTAVVEGVWAEMCGRLGISFEAVDVQCAGAPHAIE